MTECPWRIAHDALAANLRERQFGGTEQSVRQTWEHYCQALTDAVHAPECVPIGPDDG